ncbi:MAG: DUF1631 family protein [Lautropia sp.]|nr:DUF1631 family protein [Lautropia sp.]
MIEQSNLEILREIRQPILHALNRCFRSAFVSVVDYLVEQIVLETSWERQDQLNASLDLLRNGKGSIEKQFEDACCRSWQRRTGMAADGSFSMPENQMLIDEPPTLRLVDDETVRDQLLVSRISARSRRRMEEELTDGLRARFGALLGQDWFAENEYPIAPDLIFEMLREIFAAHQGQGGAQVASFLLDMFEPKLSVELNELYRDVNRRLVAYGVLPELRYSIAKSRAAALIGAAAELDEADKAGQPGHGGAGKGQGGSGEGGAHGMVSDVELGQWAEQVASQQNAEALASATRYLADPRQFGRNGQTIAHRQATSEQLMAVLNELQTRTQEANDDEDGGLLIQDVRQQSAEAAQTHGSPLDRLIIETVAQVFQHVYEDDAIANAIKQQLLRLQVAAFKAALIDPSFFARPDHPMRRFVDRLAEIGSDPDYETEPASPLVKDTEALVTWVLDNFERELVVIGEALDRTEKIIAEETARRDARLEKIAEAASRAERIDSLRAEIRQGMQQRLQRGEVPESIRNFVDSSWVELIVRLRDETENLPFDEARAQRVLDTLLWSVQPKRASEIGELAKSVPQLIADLSRGMAFIAMPSAERERFLGELMACHGKVIEQSKQRQADGAAQAVPGPARAGIGSASGQGVVTPSSAAGAARPAMSGMMAADVSRPAAGTAMAMSGHGGAAAAGPAAAASGKPDTGRGAMDGIDAPAATLEAMRRDGAPGDEDRTWDAVMQSGLSHGDEIERKMPPAEDGTEADCKRYKLGWVSPSASVFIFSRYPREHWTVNRSELNALMQKQQVRVIRKTARISAAIDSMSQSR